MCHETSGLGWTLLGTQSLVVGGPDPPFRARCRDPSGCPSPGLFTPRRSAAASSSARVLLWDRAPVPSDSFPCLSPYLGDAGGRCSVRTPAGSTPGAAWGAPQFPSAWLHPQTSDWAPASAAERAACPIAPLPAVPPGSLPKPAAVWENIRCHRWHGRCPGARRRCAGCHSAASARLWACALSPPPARGLRSSLIKNNSSDLLCPCV